MHQGVAFRASRNTQEAASGVIVSLRRSSQDHENHAYVEDEVASETRRSEAAHRVQGAVNPSQEPAVQQMVTNTTHPLSASPAQAEAGNTAEAGTVSPIGGRSRSSTISTEPFPEFDASQVETPSIVYRAQEEAYEYALSKVAEEIHRSDTSLDNRNERLTSLHGPLSSDGNGATLPPNRPSVIVLDGVQPCPEATHHDHFCEEHEARKRSVHRQVLDILLLKDDLPVAVQEEFLEITRLIVDAEYVLFRARRFPSDPLSLLSEGDLRRVRELAELVLRRLSRFGNMIYEGKKNAEEARLIVAQVAEEAGLSVLARFQRMSEIVIQYLNRVRSAEQTFFELYLQFFEQFLYDDFHIVYNNYLVEHMPNVPYRLRQTSHLFNLTSNTLAQLIKDYQDLWDINVDIGSRFIRPALDELSQGPPIWDERASRGQHEVETVAQRQNELAHQHHTQNRETHHQTHSRTEAPQADPQTPPSRRSGQGYPRTPYPRSPYPRRVDDSPPLNSHTEDRRAESSNSRRTSSPQLAWASRVLPALSSHTLSARSRGSPVGQAQLEESPFDSDTEYEPTEYVDSFQFANYYAGTEVVDASSSTRSQTVEHSDEPPAYSSHTFSTESSQTLNHMEEEDHGRSQMRSSVSSHTEGHSSLNISTHQEEIQLNHAEIATAQLLHELQVENALQEDADLDILDPSYPGEWQPGAPPFNPQPPLPMHPNENYTPHDMDRASMDLGASFGPHSISHTFTHASRPGTVRAHSYGLSLGGHSRHNNSLSHAHTQSHTQSRSRGHTHSHSHESRAASEARMQAFSEYLDTRPPQLRETAYLPPFPEHGPRFSHAQPEEEDPRGPPPPGFSQHLFTVREPDMVVEAPPLIRPTTSRGLSYQSQSQSQSQSLIVRDSEGSRSGRPTTSRGPRQRPSSPYPFGLTGAGGSGSGRQVPPRP
ncbi:hypothetical protein BJX70DRAFT_396894 [Aspergillus crustosus]